MPGDDQSVPLAVEQLQHLAQVDHLGPRRHHPGHHAVEDHRGNRVEHNLVHGEDQVPLLQLAEAQLLQELVLVVVLQGLVLVDEQVGNNGIRPSGKCIPKNDDHHRTNI